MLLLELRVTLLLRSFSNGEGDEIFSYKTTSRFFKLCCDNSSWLKMLNVGEFLWIRFLWTTPSLLEIEKYVDVYITMITWYKGVLRHSSTVTAEKCTKKCDVRAELLFVLLN